MAKLRPAADTTHTYVDTDRAMRDVLAFMAKTDRVAIDIEADSLYHYYEKVCLLQLTFRKRNFVVDPLAELNLKPFLKVLAHKTLILHGADYDLRMLRGSFDFRPKTRVIDTMIAAQLLGCQKFGLSSLIEQYSGRTLSKAGQKSDWSRRPLSRTQLRYAVDDTRYLEPLANRLLAKLSRLGRRDWFDQGCEAIMEATANKRPTDPQREWRIKGVRDLTPRQAAFVQWLWGWREREAKRADLPPFKILGNDRLLELAIWAERHPRTSLAHVPKLPRHFRRKRLESLGEMIRRVRHLRPSDWPEPRLRSPGVRKQTGKGFRRLRENVAHLAKERGLDPSVVAPRAALEKISRLRSADVAKTQQVGGLLRWQAELLAPVVRSALSAD